MSRAVLKGLGRRCEREARLADIRDGVVIVATIALSIEFLFALHLFCRFGCAVGLFQSLSWMGNDRGMVVGFDTTRASLCRQCNNACDNVCPMRLKPRSIKRRMFTCTECAQCVSACTQVQERSGRAVPADSLLNWVSGADALPVITGRAARPARSPAMEGAGCEMRLANQEEA